jgi:glutamate racemase
MPAAPQPAAPQPAAPIGVFDSGVGGLTVLRELRTRLPDEDFIYLGDTARLPYGTKSAQTVVRYSLQCASALIGRGVRALVVACNTASASALPALREANPQLPIIGVIEPGAAEAVRVSTAGRIAVIGTQATVEGGAYEAAIRRFAPHAEVSARACALFVALAEEGWVEGPIAEAIARRYLADWFSGAQAPDTLVLGCTHFPQLLGAIRAVVPAQVQLVDSARTTALAVALELGRTAPGGASSRPGRIRWLATDGAARFARVGSSFLRAALHEEQIEIIDL